MRWFPSDVVLSRAEAHDLGWTDSALTRAVRSQRLSRVRRGYFVCGAATQAQRAAAAVRASPGAVISDRTAALLHGLPLLGELPQVPELTRRPPSTGDVPAGHLYRAGLPAEHVTLLDDLPITSVGRTIVDLARHRRLGTAVAAADHALHHRLVTLDELAAVLSVCAGWPGSARARRALALVDARAESPLESLSRLTIRRFPVPAPVPQQVIGDTLGRFVARVDFGWAEHGVVGEADGTTKYTGPEVLQAEKQREERLRQLGLVVVRWTWADATRGQFVLRQRLVSAFREAEQRRRAALPQPWSVLPS